MNLPGLLTQGSYIVGVKLITMGKSPGKWLRSLLPGKKFSKSGTSKVGDTSQFSFALNYPSGFAYICLLYSKVDLCQDLETSFVSVKVFTSY